MNEVDKEKIKLLKNQNKTLKNIELNLRESNVRLQTVQTNTNHMGDEIIKMSAKLENIPKWIRWFFIIVSFLVASIVALVGAKMAIPAFPLG